MRDVFAGYYAPSDVDLEELWKSGMVVIDANILLNMYRLPEKARSALFQTLTLVANRLWLPYYAALEYQRNRIATLSDQEKKFADVMEICADVRRTLDSKINGLQLKKRHSVIDPDGLIESVARAIDTFTVQLEALRSKQPDWSRNDQIRDQIESLFNGKLGIPPREQSELDKLFKEGEQRFAKQFPPGFRDAKKSKDDDNDFAYGGLHYQRQFGDLLVWKQLIEEAKARKAQSVMLITDDEKDDWWYLHKGKKLGPRPELSKELRDQAGVKTFWMYTSDAFIETAASRYSIAVDSNAVDQVRDIRAAMPAASARWRRLERAVFDWLCGLPAVDHVEESRGPFDITVMKSDGSVIEVEVVRAKTFRSRIAGLLQRGGQLIREHEDVQVMIVIVAEDIGELAVVEGWLVKDGTSKNNAGVTIVLGVVEEADDESLRFVELT
jgi:hypothetical protein